MKEQLSIIEHMDQSKEFSVILTNKDESLLEKINRIELSVDAKKQEQQKVISMILQSFKEAGVEGLENFDEWMSLERVQAKIEELLQNYQEDSRQISTLLKDNETLNKENEDLKNSNYDLRYELQELGIKLESNSEV